MPEIKLKPREYTEQDILDMRMAIEQAHIVIDNLENVLIGISRDRKQAFTLIDEWIATLKRLRERKLIS